MLDGREVSFRLCTACADVQNSKSSRRHDRVGRIVFFPELQWVAAARWHSHRLVVRQLFRR